MTWVVKDIAVLEQMEENNQPVKREKKPRYKK